jgi:hypothetical protein
MRLHPFRSLVVACLCLSLLSLPARAGQSPSIPDDQVQARLDYIQKALAAGQPHARLWFYTWMVGYGAATAGMLAYSFANWSDVKSASGKKLPQDAFVGGIGTLIGAGTVILNPFVPAYALGRLDRLPDGTPEERLAKLQEAEDLLRRSAHREHVGRGVANYILRFGIDAAGATTAAAIYKRKWTDALLGFAISGTSTFIHIATHPTRAIHDWEDYQRTYLKGGGAAPLTLPEPSKVEWSLGGFPGGFSLRVSW